MIKTIQAKDLREDDWILYRNSSQNVRVVEVHDTREGNEVKVYHDYGNGGEPATSFFLSNEFLKISREHL